jgi:hypothetical protein
MYCTFSTQREKDAGKQKKNRRRGTVCLFLSIIIDRQEKYNSASNGGELYGLFAYVCALLLDP